MKTMRTGFKSAISAAAMLAAAGAAAAPGAARRAEAEAEARAIFEKLSPNDAVSMLMMNNVEIREPRIQQHHWWNEALHGVARAGLATVFPQAIGRAATFDAALEFKTGDAISTEARAKHNLFRAQGLRGIYTGLTMWSPNVNMFRSANWGRGQETFGEDPYLAGVMGTAFVKGMQGGDPRFLKTAACAKHYAVHSGPENLRHQFNVDLDRRDLYEYYLPAFKMLVVDGGVEQVMGAYSAVNGVPCCASKFLLRDVLRGEWGFKGTVVSDVGAVNDVWANHKYCKTKVEACLATIEGGLDLCSEGTYDCLRKEVREGRVTKEQLREPVVNILTTRILLGNIGDVKTPWDDLGEDDVATRENRLLALKVAEESMVLLKNDGVLPLDKSSLRGVEIWGMEDDVKPLVGNYEGSAGSYVTARAGIAAEFGAAKAIGGEHARVRIAFIGISPRNEGENGDKRDCRVPGVHIAQLKKWQGDRERHRVISVVYGGSPLELKEVCELSDAVMIAWYPGEQGGRAIARTLTGKNNPGGRLPLTYMEDYAGEGDIKDYTLPGRTYRYATKKPLFPFGYGLSYTTFGYSALKVAKTADGVKVEAKVTNTGKVQGDEVVQLYVRSPKGSGDRRVHHLEGFRRLRLDPGETKSVSFTLKKEQLMQFGMDGRQTLAKGEYSIFVGGGQPGFTEGVLGGRVAY